MNSSTLEKGSQAVDVILQTSSWLSSYRSVNEAAQWKQASSHRWECAALVPREMFTSGQTAFLDVEMIIIRFLCLCALQICLYQRIILLLATDLHVSSVLSRSSRCWQRQSHRIVQSIPANTSSLALLYTASLQWTRVCQQLPEVICCGSQHCEVHCLQWCAMAGLVASSWCLHWNQRISPKKWN